MNKHPTLVMILAAFGLVAVLLGIYALYDARREPQYTTPARELLENMPESLPTEEPVARIRTNQVLTAQRGKGDQIFELTVPSDCGRQRLDLLAWPDEGDIYAWVMFRVEEYDGNRVEYTGPESIDGTTESSFSWNIPEGDFVLEVDGNNVRWDFTIKCH